MNLKKWVLDLQVEQVSDNVQWRADRLGGGGSGSQSKDGGDGGGSHSGFYGELVV